jgi:hypothetical protein
VIGKKLVDRYAHQSGVKDQLVAEREVVLTYALGLLREAGALDHLAFKGGTCLRKVIFGSTGRFSEDLDFTLRTDDDQVALTAIYEAFHREHHGVTFSLPDDWYETDDGFGMEVKRKSFPVTQTMLRACQPNLRDQIVSLDPLVVVTLGTVALNATRAIEDHSLRKLAEVSTRPIPWFGRLLFPAYHTGRQARNGPTGRKPELQRQDWRELKVVLGAARASRGGQPPVLSLSADTP